MRKALIILPVKGGFVLLEQLMQEQVWVDQLIAVTGDSYSHQLTDAVTAWRSKQALADANTPPETS